jgi:UDP-N-acetylglucosamine--dolichyl-phosphate N-acetylglucosaminephosphotransferase
MLDIALAGIVFLSGLVVSSLCTPFIMRKMREAGIVGIDIHKPSKPVIPEMGGISILVGLIATVLVSSIVLPAFITEFLVFLMVTLIAGFVGLIDDLWGLHPIVKPILTALACLPILIFQTYWPHPFLPLVGHEGVRLTLVYPLLIPLAIAVPANAVNMMDPLNGVMTGTCSIVTGVFLICALLFGRYEIAVLCAGLLGCLLAFHRYNKYPARVFAGDVGSLAVGAGLGALAVIGRLEVVGIIALMPQVMNAFYGLSSIGRLYEHREVTARPISLLNDGRLMASENPRAPITLTRLLLAEGPLEEHAAIRLFFILAAFCGALAVLTAVIMLVIP